MKKYATTDLRDVPPVEFQLGDEVFRVPHKQRHDVVNLAAQSMTVVHGEKMVSVDAARQCILLMIASELWDPEAAGDPVPPETEYTPDQVTYVDGVTHWRGSWVKCDDRDRFLDLCKSPKWRIEDEVFGELLNDLVKAVAKHPTGASN